MILHRLLVAAGSAVVAFGVVAVAIIELLGPQADVGAGIVGVGAGALAGILAFVAVALLVEELQGPVRWAIDAVGALGLTLVFVGAFVYVDVVSLETTTALAVGGLAAIVAFAVGWLNGRRRDDQPTA
jgi:peptidoglycan/LPS O-acetylase OafA/YrhL